MHEMLRKNMGMEIFSAACVVYVLDLRTGKGRASGGLGNMKDVRFVVRRFIAVVHAP